MARVNISLTRKYTAALDAKMRAQLEVFASKSACAGIKGNADAAKKARVNHHGAMSTRVPARRFITAATQNLGKADFSAELRAAIKEVIQMPTLRSITHETVAFRSATRRGEQETTITRDIRGNVFGRPELGRQRGPTRVLARIAKQLAENQRQAIDGQVFEEGPTYDGDPEHNAERVVKKKGFDKPLVDTGKMKAAIRGWVE